MTEVGGGQRRAEGRDRRGVVGTATCTCTVLSFFNCSFGVPLEQINGYYGYGE